MTGKLLVDLLTAVAGVLGSVTALLVALRAHGKINDLAQREIDSNAGAKPPA